MSGAPSGFQMPGQNPGAAQMATTTGTPWQPQPGMQSGGSPYAVQPGSVQAQMGAPSPFEQPQQPMNGGGGQTYPQQPGLGGQQQFDPQRLLGLLGQQGYPRPGQY